MKKIWVLLGIVLVLLLLGFREGLQSTSYEDILKGLGQTPGYTSPTGPTGPAAPSGGSTGPTGPAAPPAPTGPTGPAEQPQAPIGPTGPPPGTPTNSGANTTGGASVTNWSGGGGSADGRIWGPPFSGTGTPRNLSGGVGGNGNGAYPTLLGPPSDASAYWAGVGVVPPSKNTLLKGSLPSSASLGSDPMSGFLPYSRQPGDQDLVPDPYRVSQTFSSASYSSKNEPVPFLTDFSAFQK